MKTCACGGTMVLKKNRLNKRIFWGCADYPACSHSKNIDEHLQTKASRRYEKELRQRLQEEVDEEETIKTELRTQQSEYGKQELISSYCTQIVLFNLLTTLKFSIGRKLENEDRIDP